MKKIVILTIVTVIVVIVVAELIPRLGEEYPDVWGTAGGPLAAFINSIIVTAAMVYAVILYGRERPRGTPTTWGEAMLGATYAFLLFALGYGIVPDRWIQYAADMGWDDPARLVRDEAIAPIDWVANLAPFDINWIHVRDIGVVLIYAVAIGLNIWLWSWWQNRGKKKVEVEPVSDFGRPLVKES